MSKKLIIWTLIVLSWGCGDVIELPEVPNLLVVEGWLTDQEITQQVKLSQTVSFEANDGSTEVTNATVTVRSSVGDFTFQHVGSGVYESTVPFAGMPGVNYWVEIDFQGDLIMSNRERMKTVPHLDSIYFDSFERPLEEDPQLEEIVYFPVGYFSDPENEQNFYRWRFQKNNEQFDEAEDIFIQEDRFFNGLELIKNEFTAFEFQPNDTIRMEIQEISFEAYDYLRLLRLQTTSLGTRNSTTPAIVRGNLTNLSNPANVILGYFGVISIKTGSQVINP